MHSKVNVLKSFPYLDGDVSRGLVAGEDTHIRSEHVDGLIAGGYVERVSDAPALPLPAQAEQGAPADAPVMPPISAAPESKRRKRK